MVRTKFLAVVVLLVAFVSPVSAKSVYDLELSQLGGEVRALMMRTDQVGPHISQERVDIEEALFELSKNLHRLSEEAASANLALLTQGHKEDRGLTYAAAIADTLDLALRHTRTYLYTRDRAFKVAASAAMQSSRALSAAQ